MSFPGDLDVAGLSNVYAQLNELLKAMHDLREEMKDMKTEVRNQISTAIGELRSEVASFKRDIRVEMNQLKSDVKKECLSAVQNELVVNMKEKNLQDDKLKWMAIDNEARSRRNNLLLYGLEESRVEKCEELVQNFIEKEHINISLKIEHINISL